LFDAVIKIHGNAEDCEDCAARDEAGAALGTQAPCTVHGSTELWQAYLAAAEALGPCRCGHPCSQHHNEDTTRCNVCECAYFKLPDAIPAPSEAPAEAFTASTQLAMLQHQRDIAVELGHGDDILKFYDKAIANVAAFTPEQLDKAAAEILRPDWTPTEIDRVFFSAALRCYARLVRERHTGKEGKP
jgi:hypothetical protein